MASTPSGSRSTRTRWWMILISTSLILIIGAVAFVALERASGRRAYAAQVDADRAAGRMTTVDEFVARAPAVDPAVQQAWDAWTHAVSASWTEPNYDQAGWDRWIVDVGPSPESIVRTVEERRATMTPALDLLRQDGVILSAWGWAAIDLPPGRRGHADVERLRSPNLLVLRDLGTWLAYAAVLAEDATGHLDDLARLQVAMGQPATLMDAMMEVAVASIRDRAYLELAVRGALPGDAAARWLAEPSRALERLAPAYAVDRALFSSYGDYLSQSSPWGLHTYAASAYFDWSPWRTLQLWTFGPQERAENAALQAHYAERLSGQRADAPVATGRRTSLWDQSASLQMCVITTLEADARQRMTRLAVEVLALARRGGLPADHAALLTALGTARIQTPGDHLHLRYERLSAERFRLTVDPASPLPNFDDPSRMGERTKAIGTPPATAPMVSRTQHALEVPVTGAAGDAVSAP